MLTMQTPATTIRQRMVSLRWVLSAAWILGVIVYQLVIANWVHDNISEGLHYAVEILFYGSIGPILAILFLV